MPSNRGSGSQAGGPEVDGRGWGQPSGMIDDNFLTQQLKLPWSLLTLAWLSVGSSPSNVRGGGDIGNVSEGGGEYFVEGGMNQRHRREPTGPPQDIGSDQMRGDAAPGLGDSEEIPDR